MVKKKERISFLILSLSLFFPFFSTAELWYFQNSTWHFVSNSTLNPGIKSINFNTLVPLEVYFTLANTYTVLVANVTHKINPGSRFAMAEYSLTDVWGEIQLYLYGGYSTTTDDSGL